MPEDKIPITITLRERDLLLNETTAVDDDVLARVRVAEVVGGGVRFSLSSDDLNLLLHGLSYEADDTDDEKIQAAFDRLLDRLAEIYDRHADPDAAQVPYMSSPPEGVMVLDRSKVNEELVRLKHQELFSFGRRPVQQYLDEPIPTLGGLTPKQALALFRDGWWGPEPLIRLNADLGLADLAGCRFLNNARLLLAALRDAGGAPLTVKGNLARRFVGEMLESLELEEGHKDEVLRYNKVVNEDDLWPLHVLRLVCEAAKLVRKYKKRLVATKLGLALLAEEKAGQLCVRLFDAHFTEFSLAYLDRLPDEYGTVQDFFPYAL